MATTHRVNPLGESESASVSGRWEGGCLCGQVRYVAVGPPAFSIICYCRQCQHITGTGHAPQFAVRRDAVSVNGLVRDVKLRADSGHEVRSMFCPTCGSPVYKGSDGHADYWFFHAGTLDDPSLYQPQSTVWTRSHQPWDPPREGLPSQP